MTVIIIIQSRARFAFGESVSTPPPWHRLCLCAFLCVRHQCGFSRLHANSTRRGRFSSEFAYFTLKVCRIIFPLKPIHIRALYLRALCRTKQKAANCKVCALCIITIRVAVATAAASTAIIISTASYYVRL